MWCLNVSLYVHFLFEVCLGDGRREGEREVCCCFSSFLQGWMWEGCNQHGDSILNMKEILWHLLFGNITRTDSGKIFFFCNGHTCLLALSFHSTALLCPHHQYNKHRGMGKKRRKKKRQDFTLIWFNEPLLKITMSKSSEQSIKALNNHRKYNNPLPHPHLNM